MSDVTLNGLKRFLCGIGLLVLAVPVQGASFDCGKAQTKVEHMICDDPELSKLDDELNAAYKAALKDANQLEATKRAQKQWMKERNLCSDVACVKTAYQQRIGQLQPAQAMLVQSDAKSMDDSEQSETVCLAPKIDWRNYEWTLITGKGEAVCEEMLAYLKSRPTDAPPPTCPEERLPQNGNWSRPESRVLSEEERQAILRDMPEKYRHFQKGRYEKNIRGFDLLRVIHGDITGDGIPESLLAMSNDYRLICQKSKQCARSEEVFKGGIVLFSDGYELLPMNGAGTHVNWAHPTFEHTPPPPLLMDGELIYFRDLPYLMTPVMWSQNTHDNFAHYSMRPWDVNSKIFTLAKVSYGSKSNTTKFEDAFVFYPTYLNPENEQPCRIGYFHRDNLKLNAVRKGK